MRPLTLVTTLWPGCKLHRAVYSIRIMFGSDSDVLDSAIGRRFEVLKQFSTEIL